MAGLSQSLMRASRTPRAGAIAVAACIIVTAHALPVTAGSLALRLDEAISLALSNSELLQQTADAVTAAEAEVMAAGAGRLPQLNLGAEWTANFVKPVFFLPPELLGGGDGPLKVEMGRDYSLQGGISLTWNLWTAGRLSAAMGTARELVAASRWQQSAVSDAVRFQATAAYLDLLLAAQRVRIAEEALATTAEALRVARAGGAQGTVSRFDILRAEVELANREAPLIQARNLRRHAELVLNRICGLDPGTMIAPADTLAPVPQTGRPSGPEAAEALVAAMREQSPELNAIRHRVAAARQGLSLARAARGPVVQLHGRYGVQGEWDHDIAPSSEERASSAGAGLSVAFPIFDGRQARAGIESAEARLRTARLELARLDRDRALAVRQAVLQLESALAALEGRRENVALAAEAYRLAAVRLENGLATPLERLDAELALTYSRVQLAEALHACRLSRAAVNLAVGGDPGIVTATLSVSESQEANQ